MESANDDATVPTAAETSERPLHLLVRLYGAYLTILGLLVFAALNKWGTPGTWGFKFAESVGFALMPTGALALLFEFVTRRDYHRLMRQDFGHSLAVMSAVCGRCKAYGIEALMLARPADAQKRIFAAAEKKHGLRVLCTALEDFGRFDGEQALSHVFKRRCKVRILFLNPKSDATETRAHEEHKRPKGSVAGAISASMGRWRGLWESLAESEKEHVEFRHYDTLPRYYMLMSAGGLLVGHYPAGRRGNESLHLVVEPDSELARHYVDHFEAVWGGASKWNPAVPVQVDGEHHG